MSKKSFVLGFAAGAVVTILVLMLVGYLMNRRSNDDPIHYLEQAVSYENKAEASFEVFQVSGNAALAKEASDRLGREVVYHGNTVLLLGENFYSNQVVVVKNPQQVGTYSYTNNRGMPMTVPVINCNME